MLGAVGSGAAPGAAGSGAALGAAGSRCRRCRSTAGAESGRLSLGFPAPASTQTGSLWPLHKQVSNQQRGVCCGCNNCSYGPGYIKNSTKQCSRFMVSVPALLYILPQKIFKRSICPIVFKYHCKIPEHPQKRTTAQLCPSPGGTVQPLSLA